MHERMAAALDTCVEEIAAIQRAARTDGVTERPRWPMIVLRTPKGWTGPKSVDGLPDRGHVALAPGAARGGAHEPGAPRAARGWLRSYRAGGAVRRGWRARRRARGAAAEGHRRMSANPHANGGLLLEDLVAARLPRLRRRGGEARHDARRGDARARHVPPRRHPDEPDRFRLFGPDETASNRLGAVFEATDRAWDAEMLADRRPPLTRRRA